MRVRQIDVDHDWLFGKGQNDYVRGNAAIVQTINTRLNSFLGDCFFDIGAGIDWFNLLGSKDQTALNLAISAVIDPYIAGIRVGQNTPGVVRLVQLSTNLNTARRFTVTYQVDTVYSRAVAAFTLNTSEVE